MKNNKFLTIFLILILSFVMPLNLKSQIVEVGATGGLSYYIGDINPSKHFLQSEIAYGGAIRYYQNLRWAFRIQYSRLNLTSSDEVANFRPERDLAFKSKVNDFAFIAEFNFFDYWTGSRNNYVSPYIFAGVSFLTFKSTDLTGRELQPMANEGVYYNTYSWSIPFGLGVKYSLTKRLGATLEWRMHKAFTDYIDDIEGYYLDIPEKQRGNGNSHMFGYNNDWYGILGLTISYRFNLPDRSTCHYM